MHSNKDDLEYTADGIRERHVGGGYAAEPASEDRVQASMQEETAKAIYALRDTVEKLVSQQEPPEGEFHRGLYLMADTPLTASQLAGEGAETDIETLADTLETHLDQDEREAIARKLIE